MYHAGVSILPGGFVGVDVFFVLSGYLITELLVHEIEHTKRLDALRFYARRARRLLPASATVVSVTLAAAALICSPLELERISTSAGATALYVSNVWFFQHTGDYFAPAAETNPLLHTWSLAVSTPRAIAMNEIGNSLEVEAVAGLTHVSRIDLSDLFCTNATCEPIRNDMVVYRDSNHLTATFVGGVGPRAHGQDAPHGRTTPIGLTRAPMPLQRRCAGAQSGDRMLGTRRHSHVGIRELGPIRTVHKPRRQRLR